MNQQQEQHQAEAVEAIGETISSTPTETRVDAGDLKSFIVERLQADEGARQVGLGAHPSPENGDAGAALIPMQGKQGHADLMAQLATDHAQYFHDEERNAYARIDCGDHLETWPVTSEGFRLWAEHLFYHFTQRVISESAFNAARKTLMGKAVYFGRQEKVWLRYAWNDDAIYVDLCNCAWEQVKITPDGWQIIDSRLSPVNFRRVRGMTQLPHPQKGGQLEWLKGLLNLEDEESWTLVASWLVAAMRPTGPFPILILQGEQGTSKTTTSRILRSLVDPSAVPCRTLPGSERDLAISANSCWVLSFDNLSSFKPKMADAFCRVSTGGGFSTRTLRTDRGEELFSFMRPMILNGIAELTERHDLADRSLIIQLPMIRAERRLPEQELWNEWYQLQPMVLGALYDAVAVALRNYRTVQLAEHPRMADFAKWAVAAEPALLDQPGQFTRAYQGSQKQLVEAGIEADPVATTVLRMMSHQPRQFWKGSPAELFQAVCAYAPDHSLLGSGFPKAPNALSNRLARAQGLLRNKGYRIIRSKSGERSFIIYRHPSDRGDGLGEHRFISTASAGHPGFAMPVARRARIKMSGDLRETGEI